MDRDEVVNAYLRTIEEIEHEEEPAEEAIDVGPFTPNSVRMLFRLRHISTYSAGWNYPDTLAPSPVAIQDADRFVRIHDLPSWPLPCISATDDGGINFWWDDWGFWVDLSFDGDGTYSLYARLANSQDIRVDHAQLTQPFPAEIVHFFEEHTP